MNDGLVEAGHQQASFLPSSLFIVLLEIIIIIYTIFIFIMPPFQPHGLITDLTLADLYRRGFPFVDCRYSMAAEWYPDPEHGEQANIVVRYCQSGDATQQVLLIGECKKTTRNTPYSLKNLEWQAFRYCQMYLQSDEGQDKEI